MIRNIFQTILATAALAVSAHAGTGSTTSTYNDTLLSSVDWVPTTADSEIILDSGSSQTAAVVDLIVPAVLYGEPTRQIVVSRHGYISWDATDDGTDDTFDNPLPAAPSNGGGAKRLYPLHAKHTKESEVTYRYIPEGAHPDNRWGAHVITWEDAELSADSAESFDFQALIFDDFEIIYQYKYNAATDFLNNSVVGIQGAATGSDFLTSSPPGNAVTGQHEWKVRIQPPTLVINNPNPSTFNYMQGVFNTAIDGQRICFNYTNGVYGTMNISGGSGAFVSNKTVAVVGSAGGMEIQGSVNLNFSNNADSIAMLGIDLDGPRINADGPALVRGADFTSSISSSIGSVTSDESVVVYDCSFVDSDQASSLGGGAIRAPEVHATDSTFTDCDATGVTIITQGGAIKIDGTADSTLTRCAFNNNTSTGAGGAVYAIGGGRLDITDCTFDSNSSDGNTTQNAGGAVGLVNTDSTILRSLFINNDGGNAGGALSITGTSSVLLRHSAFDANSADEASAISHNGDLLDIRHCNIVRNTVNTLGEFAIGGNDSPTVSKYNLYLRNFDPDTDYRHIDPASTNFTSQGWNAYDALSVSDHPFVHLEDFALPLSFPMITDLPGGTPIGQLIDDSTDLTSAGSTGSDTDLRGNPRLLGSHVDIGAFEYLETMIVDSLDDDPTPGGLVSLREAWARSDRNIEIDPALAGGTITLTSPLPTRLRRTNVSFTSAANLDGQFVTIDGAAADSIIVAATVSWRNVRFVNFPGYAIETNSELFQFKSFAHCEFTRNGGAITDPTSQNLNLDLSSCRFYENGFSATPLPLIDTAQATVTRCQFDHNLGTVFSLRPNTTSSESLRLVFSTIARNATRAIHVPTSTDPGTVDVKIDSSTISTNAADNGSTIVCDHPTALIIDRSTIANNGGDTSTSSACIVAQGTSTITTEESLYENNKKIFSDQGIVTSGDYNIFDEGLSASALAANDLENTKTHLAPLSRYQRPDATVAGITQPVLTHALLAISPAIDSGPNAGGSDGDGDGTATTDRGFSEAAAPIFVTSTGNSGPGTLRQAIIDAPDGGRILFDPSLSPTSTTVLATDINITKDLQIDATNRRQGMLISGNAVTRIFDVQGGARFAIHALRLFNGAGTGNFSSALRIRDGWGTASNCSITDCSANRGTAAYVEAGGLYLLNCTIANNTGSNGSGALDFFGDTENRIEHCTIARNYSSVAGAVRLRDDSLVHGSYNLVANNFLGTPASPGAASDFYANTPSGIPERFISAGYNHTTDGSTDVIAAFNSTGDKTKITAPIFTPGYNVSGWSAVLSAPLTVSILDQNSDAPAFPTFDQSGYARIAGGSIDIGARELGGESIDTDNDGLPDYWEYLYGFEPLFTNDASGNPDGDGADNLAEFQNGTHPRIANGFIFPEIISFGRSLIVPNDIVLQFMGPAATDYEFQSSPDLTTWTTIFTITTSGSPQSITQPIAPDRIFYRFAIP